MVVDQCAPNHMRSPDRRHGNDECGCCGETCPTDDCTCECDSGAGYMMVPGGDFGHDGYGDDDDDGTLLHCILKESAVVAVANGRASCYEGCSCGA